MTNAYPQWKPTLRGHEGCLLPPPKDGTTLPLPDDSYAKSICPSGGHGRGQRLALLRRYCISRELLATASDLGPGNALVPLRRRELDGHVELAFEAFDVLRAGEPGALAVLMQLSAAPGPAMLCVDDTWGRASPTCRARSSTLATSGSSS